MYMLCKYKDILGIPGKGVHSYRFMDTAVVDYLGTILLAVILTKYTKIPLVLSTILMFILGIVLHVLFCVPTGATRYLGF
jgi:hypothetical protein